ncbi:hypothetical protein POVWA2_004240 [Plasmodium ovale wallikeri]|uniref:Uncharacterized protein n=1 Tax=Plasmodium ovale wallikeri TaxID=864142 RepID=A0A1A8YH14_PLAOA|nr:hypothetical protein POVWA1_004100 [Plasmodium ovale wallikeri]SBT31447.1 hypothetical protein POVWA2_004240 [Plasmodium ovale wallikeri]
MMKASGVTFVNVSSICKNVSSNFGKLLISRIAYCVYTQFRWFKPRRENKISSRKVAGKDERSGSILEEIFHQEQKCERGKF